MVIFYKSPRNEKPKQQWLIEIIGIIIQSIHYVRMCLGYFFGQSHDWKKMRLQLVLNKNFWETSPPLIDWQLKHRQISEISKTLVSTSTSSVFHRKFTILEIKSKLVFHPNGNWIQTAMSQSSSRILKLYVPTDSEHKLHKTGIENWLPKGFNLAWSSLGTRSHNHYSMFNH